MKRGSTVMWRGEAWLVKRVSDGFVFLVRRADPWSTVMVDRRDVAQQSA